MDLYIFKNGTQYGPLTPQQAREGIQNGQFQLDDRAITREISDWTSLSEVLKRLEVREESVRSENGGVMPSTPPPSVPVAQLPSAMPQILPAPAKTRPWGCFYSLGLVVLSGMLSSVVVELTRQNPALGSLNSLFNGLAGIAFIALLVGLISPQAVSDLLRRSPAKNVPFFANGVLAQGVTRKQVAYVLGTASVLLMTLGSGTNVKSTKEQRLAETPPVSTGKTKVKQPGLGSRPVADRRDAKIQPTQTKSQVPILNKPVRLPLKGVMDYPKTPETRMSSTRWNFGLQGKVKLIEEYEIKDDNLLPNETINFNEGGMLSERIWYIRGEEKSISRREYNSQGRLLKLIGGLPEGTVTSMEKYKYGTNGKLIHTEIVAEEYQIFENYSYNPDGSLQRINENAKRERGQGTKKTDYEYEDGRLAREVSFDSDGGVRVKAEYHYNKQGYLERFISNMQSLNGSPRTDTWSYTYRPNGMIRQMRKKFGIKSASDLGENISEFNSHGDESTFTIYSKTGEIDSEIAMVYKYDSKGNWIQKTQGFSDRSRQLKQDDPTYKNAKSLCSNGAMSQTGEL